MKISHFVKFSTIEGPESIAEFNGKLVTSSRDGFIYQILNDDTVKKLIRIRKPDDEADLMQKFNTTGKGRPLGLKFDSRGNLFVVETSLGIYKVANVFGPNPTATLVLGRETLGKHDGIFFDDLAVQEKPNGNDYILYVSLPSIKFNFEEMMLILLGSDVGRVIQYDTETKELTLLADSMHFPNGVELSPNQDTLFFVEGLARQVYKYHLAGPRKGTLDLLLKNLPGEPDNIRRTPRGTYWISCMNPRTLVNPNEFDYYIRKPFLRKLLLRTSNLVGSILSHLVPLYPSEELASLAAELKTGNFLFFDTLFRPEGGMLIEFDSEGNILNTLTDINSDKLDSVSEVREIKSSKPGQRILYLGSFQNRYARRVVVTKQ